LREITVKWDVEVVPDEVQVLNIANHRHPSCAPQRGMAAPFAIGISLGQSSNWLILTRKTYQLRQLIIPCGPSAASQEDIPTSTNRKMLFSRCVPPSYTRRAICRSVHLYNKPMMISPSGEDC
jgi:hypothetical protein